MSSKVVTQIPNPNFILFCFFTSDHIGFQKKFESSVCLSWPFDGGWGQVTLFI